MTKRATKMSWKEVDAREVLQRYEPLVQSIARRLRPAASAGQALDQDDLCAEGRVAVLEALATYEGFGISEKTWVRTRIRQRMIDAIRRLDLRSRDELRLAVKHSSGELEDRAENERGREVAARRLVSFDHSPAGAEPLSSRLKSSPQTPSDSAALGRVQGQRLIEAMDALPPRQRRAIQLGLLEGLQLREIGNRMGISESRVCQLQKRAVAQLKQAIVDASVSASL